MPIAPMRFESRGALQRGVWGAPGRLAYARDPPYARARLPRSFSNLIQIIKMRTPLGYKS